MSLREVLAVECECGPPSPQGPPRKGAAATSEPVRVQGARAPGSDRAWPPAPSSERKRHGLEGHARMQSRGSWGVTGSHGESRGAQGFGEKTREKCRVLVSAQCYGYLLAVIFIVSQRNLVNQSSCEKRIPLKTSRPCPPPASAPSSPSPSTPSPAEGLLRAALDALRTSV